MPEIRYHSQVALSAYHDLLRNLLRNLLDAPAAEVIGAPTRVTVKGRLFWYDKYRVGNEMAQR